MAQKHTLLASTETIYSRWQYRHILNGFSHVPCDAVIFSAHRPLQFAVGSRKKNTASTLDSRKLTEMKNYSHSDVCVVAPFSTITSEIDFFLFHSFVFYSHVQWKDAGKDSRLPWSSLNLLRQWAFFTEKRTKKSKREKLFSVIFFIHPTDLRGSRKIAQSQAEHALKIMNHWWMSLNAVFVDNRKLFPVRLSLKSRRRWQRPRHWQRRKFSLSSTGSHGEHGRNK